MFTMDELMGGPEIMSNDSAATRSGRAGRAGSSTGAKAGSKGATTGKKDDSKSGRAGGRSTRGPGGVNWLLVGGLSVALGVVVGLLVGGFSQASAGSVSTIMVNTRPTSDLPNERLDLITDLRTAVTLRPVLDEVSGATDVPISELQSGVTVQRVESSSFAEISFTSSRSAATRRVVLQELVDASIDYLGASGDGPSAALEAARDAQRDATKDYYDLLAANKGVDPSETLPRLEQRLTRLREAGLDGAVSNLERARTRLLRRVQDFEQAKVERQATAATLTAVSEEEAARSATGASAMTADFVTPASSGMSSSVPLRRGVAGGIATAVLVAGFVLALTRVRQRADS